MTDVTALRKLMGTVLAVRSIDERTNYWTEGKKESKKEARERRMLMEFGLSVSKLSSFVPCSRKTKQPSKSQVNKHPAEQPKTTHFLL